MYGMTIRVFKLLAILGPVLSQEFIMVRRVSNFAIPYEK